MPLESPLDKQNGVRDAQVVTLEMLRRVPSKSSTAGIFQLSGRRAIVSSLTSALAGRRKPERYLAI
jgi:hypothetical protein